MVFANRRWQLLQAFSARSMMAAALLPIGLPASWYQVVVPYRYDRSQPYAAGWHRGADVRVLGGAFSVRAVSGGTVLFAGSVAGRGVVTVASQDARWGRVVVTYTGVGANTGIATGSRIHRGQSVGRSDNSWHRGQVHIGMYEHGNHDAYLPMRLEAAAVAAGSRQVDRRLATPQPVTLPLRGMSGAVLTRMIDAVNGTARLLPAPTQRVPVAKKSLTVPSQLEEWMEQINAARPSSSSSSMAAPLAHGHGSDTTSHESLVHRAMQSMAQDHASTSRTDTSAVHQNIREVGADRIGAVVPDVIGAAFALADPTDRLSTSPHALVPRHAESSMTDSSFLTAIFAKTPDERSLPQGSAADDSRATAQPAPQQHSRLHTLPVIGASLAPLLLVLLTALVRWARRKPASQRLIHAQQPVRTMHRVLQLEDGRIAELYAAVYDASPWATTSLLRSTTSTPIRTSDTRTPPSSPTSSRDIVDL